MKYLLIIAFTISSFMSCSQSKYVQKVYAFTETRFPGNIQTDENGNAIKPEPNILHFVFIELPNGVSPIWESAIVDGRPYTIFSNVVEDIPLQVGEQKSDNRMVVIKLKAGNKLWRLDLNAKEDNKLSPVDKTVKGIILKGTYKKQKINCTIAREVELAPAITQ